MTLSDEAQPILCASREKDVYSLRLSCANRRILIKAHGALFLNWRFGYDLLRDQTAAIDSHTRPLGRRKATDAAGHATASRGILATRCRIDTFRAVRGRPDQCWHSRDS